MIVLTASLNIQNGHAKYAGRGYINDADIPQGTEFSEKDVVSSSPVYGWVELNYKGKIVRIKNGDYKLEED